MSLTWLVGPEAAIASVFAALYLSAGIGILSRSPTIMARGIPARLIFVFASPLIFLVALPAAWRAARRSDQP